MELIPAVIALLAAAGGGAGINQVRLARRQDEQLAVKVIREVLSEVRQELIDKQKEWEVLFDLKQQELKAIQTKLDVATEALEKFTLGDGPPYLS